MRRFSYPNYNLNSNVKFTRYYSPNFKSMYIDNYKPSIKSVGIELFYSILFSHHVPSLMRGSGFFGNTKLIDFSSIHGFLTSYIGKIIFFFIVYYILHFFILTLVRKIDISKLYPKSKNNNKNASN